MTVAVSGLLGLALAGCGAGLDAASSRTLESVPGVDADVAGIAVRNAMVLFEAEGYPAGADAPLELSIVNRNDQSVRLVEATAEAVRSVTVASVVRIGGTATPAPAEPAEPELVVGPGELVNATLQLTGIGQPLNGTSAVPVTLTFDNGAEIPLNVPLATPLEAQPREPMELEAEH
jgi:copper(I)-binding protein